jgi:cation diffusion facilitator family transporter
MSQISQHQNFLIKASSYASVTVSLIIMSIKLYGWLSTSSQSVLASLVDSMLDISSSVINLLAVRIALLPPDDNHRFGHEKFQDLAVFSQSIFFFISCLFAASYSIYSLFTHSAPSNNELGADLMILCIIITVLLVSFQSFVIKHTNSKIVQVDKLHYFADLMSNVAVVASLYLSAHIWYLDAIVGILISIYIAHGAWGLFIGALKNLVDEEFSPEHRATIISIIDNSPDVKGWHDLKTRWAGSKPFIQLHLELEGSLTLEEAHHISEKISGKIREQFQNADITIHEDPYDALHQK